MVVKFSIIPGDDFIWNRGDLIKFLINHQGKSFTITTTREGCCARSVGLYDLLDQFSFEDVVIETSNPLEYHDRYKIDFKCWRFLQVKRPIESQYHCWSGNKLFGAIYGRPLWHRIGIASHLSYHHSDRSLVGMLGNTRDDNQRNLFEIQKLWNADPTSFRAFSMVVDKFPIQINGAEMYTPGQHDTDGYVSQVKSVYPNFLIDVVAETFTTGRCFFVTEKTVRPMLLKKPFILMGSKHSLLYLKQMGFKTFSNFWDEGYDNYGENNRYHQIITLIDFIAKKSQSDLESMYNQMHEILDHNYNLLMNQSFNFDIKCHRDLYE